MLNYSRDPNTTVDPSAVRILGLGGAGANILERVALDGSDPRHLVLLNTDIRPLEASLAGQKIQLGANLTRGLGTGGDPELGAQAALESEAEIRDCIRGTKIVFVCAGLGGGTGSGAAPMITRIAREEGAFVVVFATMPFVFEGRRRREQAQAALNELAALSNALVTFDNTRMGDLVLASKGIHEAFSACDQMIGEAIKAVIRLVTRPGLIHIGLDELMTALRTTRSRCLFGSGVADGQDRATRALESALTSPLLDQGALLRETNTVLVHLCGGEDFKLYEIELLMQELQKLIPEKAQILFGAAIDATMGSSVSVTLISSLPEENLVSEASAPSPSALPKPEPVAEKPPETAPKSVPPREETIPPPSSISSVFETPPKEPEAIVPPPVSIAEFSSPPAPEPSGDSVEKKTDDPPPPESPKLKLGVKGAAPDTELELDSTPRGRFDGQSPNVVDGEDLDLPPFLRKKK